MSEQEILTKLEEAITGFDEEAAVEAATSLLAEKGSPLKAVDVMSTAMRVLGDKFEKMEVFLPEIVLASEALKAAMKVLEPEILKKGDGIKRPVVVIGTVKGDVHTVGKDMVATLLMTAGFDVVDLGPDTAPSKFLEVAQDKKAAIIAASALMSTTLPVQKDLIDFLQAKGVRKDFKVLVGGGVCTDEWAKRIGADGYSQDAVEGVQVAKQLVARN